jgi:hypothetical protein
LPHAGAAQADHPEHQDEHQDEHKGHQDHQARMAADFRRVMTDLANPAQ